MNTTITLQQREKAIVIGGGIAGLLAARVLAEEYAEVLVIERDGCPEKPGARAGAPQSFHLHQVLPRGEVILQQLFPGFLADLKQAGAYQLRQETLTMMVNPYGAIPFPMGAGEEQGITYSRGLLEWEMRQRVQGTANIHFLY